MNDRTLKDIFDKWLSSVSTEEPSIDYRGDSMTYFKTLHYRGEKIEDIKRIHPELSYEIISMLKMAIVVDEVKSYIASMKEKMNLSMRGKFKTTDKTIMIKYTKGDVVRYKNQDYVAVRTISNGISPQNEQSGWKPLSLNDVLDSGTFPDE